MDRKGDSTSSYLNKSYINVFDTLPNFLVDRFNVPLQDKGTGSLKLALVAGKGLPLVGLLLVAGCHVLVVGEELAARGLAVVLGPCPDVVPGSLLRVWRHFS